VADADPACSAANPAALRIDSLPVTKLDRGYLAEHKIVGFNAGDSRSRAFNLLRTRLSKLLPGPAARLIGITSATPAAGKSFISANLALSLAKVAEGPVILVDLDLRRGSVAVELGLEPAHGVRDFLTGETTLQKVGVRIEGLPLAVLPTNVALRDSAELLSGDRFAELLATLRGQPANTVVLCDLPPVFANDDAMLSIEHLDGYVLVVDSSVTSKAHVQQAMAMLDPAPCIGTVLNRYRGTMIEKYGYGYGTGAYGEYYQS
jgi:Mrp family chromosome partitioning ATPase